MPEPWRKLAAFGADTAVVLGSGLGAFVEHMSVEDALDYAAFADLPISRVAGHHGRFVLGKIGAQRLIVAQGRVHLYEGWSAKETTAHVRQLAEAGARRILLTNAAGSLQPDFSPGSWMLIADHLNLTGTSPLLGGAHFHDMSAIYHPASRERLRTLAAALGLTLHEGVYAGLLGPQYETPAEIRMLRHCGADAVGMSTVLEAIQARALGLEVIGFSCLTNWAAGMAPGPLDHAKVITTARTSAAADALAALLEAFFQG